MTEGKDLTTEVVKEVAKQLPVKEVYADTAADSTFFPPED